MARGQSIYGTDGDDVRIGGSGNDFIYGYGGNDELRGEGGDDQLQGGAGDDLLYGGEGRDRIFGQGGSDYFDGGGGDDTLVAGGISGGGDTLVGGGGADLFEWVGRFVGTDTIVDFLKGLDRIDLSRIDADERTAPGTIKGKNTPGNEAFQIVATTDGVTPGALTISSGLDGSGNAITTVRGYTDTVAGADFEIHLLGSHNLTAADFIL